MHLTRQRSLKDCKDNRADSGFGLSSKRSFSSTEELKLIYECTMTRCECLCVLTKMGVGHMARRARQVTSKSGALGLAPELPGR